MMTCWSTSLRSDQRSRSPERVFTFPRNERSRSPECAATTRRWKNQAGEKQERTEWHRVVSFGPTAEFLKEYATKGSLVHVEGSLQTREWTDRGGIKRFTTEILSRRVQLMGSTNRQPASSPPPTEEPLAAAEVEAHEDDIPF